MAFDEEYTVLLALQARDQASQMLAGADRLLGKLESHSQKVNAGLLSVSNGMKAVGTAGLGMAVGVAGFFATAEHAAIGLQDALSTVQINAHLTEEATSALGRAIEHTAIGTTSSATEMVTALGPVAGELKAIGGDALTAADATDVLRASQNLLVTSGGSLAGNTKAIADLLLIYKLKASDAAAVSDTLFQGHALLGIGVQQLATMFQRLQPRIAGSGVDMNHLLAIVKELRPEVGTGARAIMSVGSIIQRLVTPSKGAAAALAALGVSLRDSKGNFIGLEPAVEKLRLTYLKLPKTLADSKLGHRLLTDQQLLAKLATQNQTKTVKEHEAALTKEIKTIIAHGGALTQDAFLQSMFGAQANAVKALILAGSDGIDKNTKALAENGTAAAAAALKMGDAKAQMEALPKTLETLTESIGMVLLPALNRILTPILSVAGAVADWVVQNPELATGILAVVGGLGALAGVLAFAGPIMAVAFGLFVGVVAPVALLAGGVALLVRSLLAVPAVMAPVNVLFGVLRDAVTTVTPFFMSFVGAIGDLIAGKGGLDTVGGAFVALLGSLGGVGGRVAGALGNIGGAIVGWVASQVPSWTAALPVWTAAIVNWVSDAIRSLIGALGGFVGPIVTWVANAVPSWVAALESWTLAIAGWVGRAISVLIDRLGTFIQPIVRWVADQVPVWANALVAWTVALVNWVTSAIPVLIGRLSDFVTPIVEWVRNQVPHWTDALVAWTGSLVDWVVNSAVPTFTTALNGIIEAVVSWIGDGSTISRLVSSLVDWVAPFVAWAATAAVAIVAGLALWLGTEVVKEGPAIVAAVLVGGASIIAGLAEGLIAHPEILVAAFGALMALRAVQAAIIGAGALSGAIYSGAVNVLNTLITVMLGVWSGIVDSVAETVTEAGLRHGVIYSTAVRVGQFILEALRAIWVLLGGELAVTAAAAGAIDGAAYEEGMITATSGGVAVPMLEGALAGGTATATAAGAAAGGGFISGLIGFITSTGAVLFAAALPALLTKPIDNPANGEDTLFGPRGPLNFAANAYDSVFNTNYGGNKQIPPEPQDRPSGVGPGGPRVYGPPNTVPDSVFSTLGSNLGGLKLPPNIFGAIPTALAAAARQADVIAKGIPKSIHDAIASGESQVQAGIAALHTAEHLKHDLKHAMEVAQVEMAVAAGKTPASALHSMGIHGKALAAALKDPQIKAAAALGGEIAKDLKSSDPVVSGAAKDLLGQIKSQAEVLKTEMKNYGKNTANAFVNGWVATAANAAARIGAWADFVTNTVHGKSPPTIGPLSDIDKWGFNVGNAWLGGFVSAAAGAQKTAGVLAGSVAPHLRAGAAASGRSPVHVNVGGPRVTVHVTLDGRELKNIISRMLFDEERQHSGAAEVGSPF